MPAHTARETFLVALESRVAHALVARLPHRAHEPIAVGHVEDDIVSRMEDPKRHVAQPLGCEWRKRASEAIGGYYAAAEAARCEQLHADGCAIAESEQEDTRWVDSWAAGETASVARRPIDE